MRGVSLATIGAASCVAACSALAGLGDDYSAGSSDAGPEGAAFGEAAAPEGGAKVPPLPSGSAQDLATGQQTPRDIVVDDTHVYWLNVEQGPNAGSIWMLAKNPDAGQPAMMTTVESGTRVLVADANTLYWGGGPGAQRWDKSCGPSGTCAPPPPGVFWYGQSDSDPSFQGLAVAGGILFATGGGGGGEVQSNHADAMPDRATRLQQGLGDVGVVTVAATDVYVAKTGSILSVPKTGAPDGSAPVVFANTNGSVQAITNDETSVYWLETTSVLRLDIANSGGTVVVLASGQDTPSALAVDDAYVYWTNAGDGLVQAIPKGGGAAKTLAKGENEPRGIAVDAAGIYWTNSGDGRVRVIWR